MIKLIKNTLMSSLLIALMLGTSFSAFARTEVAIPPVECVDCGGTIGGGGIIGGGDTLKPGTGSNNELTSTCTKTPSCAYYGYKANVKNCNPLKPIVRCPSDPTQIFCAEEGEPEPIVPIQAGQIYYSDGTISWDVISGKTAVGIVFGVSPDQLTAPAGSRALVVALQDGGMMSWDDGSVDITALENYNDSSFALADMNGKNNTSAIVAQRGSSAKAAYYCANYSTTGTLKGQWFLPSLGQLQQMYYARDYINAGLDLLGKTSFPVNTYHWSSTENYGLNAWQFGISNGFFPNSQKGNAWYVRPVMAI